MGSRLGDLCYWCGVAFREGETKRYLVMVPGGERVGHLACVEVEVDALIDAGADYLGDIDLRG